MNNPSKTFKLLRLYPWLSTDPVTGREGEIYYNTISKTLRVCTGGSPLWKATSITGKIFGQNANAQLIGGGTFSVSAPTSPATVSWSGTAYLRIPNMTDAENEIAAGSYVLNDGESLYVQINRSGLAQVLTVLTALESSITVDEDTFIIARGYTDRVEMVGGLTLRDEESSTLDQGIDYKAIQNTSHHVISGATFTYTSGTLSWDTDINVQAAGIANLFKTIPTGNVILALGEAAYYTLDRRNTAQSIALTVASIEDVPVEPNVFIFAVRYATDYVFVEGNVYFEGDSRPLYQAGGAAGANQNLSNLLSPTAINQHLFPDTTNTKDLGSTSQLFKDLYLGMSVHVESKDTNGVQAILYGNNSSGGGSPASMNLHIARDNFGGTQAGDTWFQAGTGNLLINAYDNNTLTPKEIRLIANSWTSTPTLRIANSKIYSTVALDLNGQLINNMADPVSAQDAATKAYVDANSSQWANNGADIYFNTGNVGIGTSTPSFRLQVVADGSNVGMRISNSDVRYRSDFERTSTEFSINAYDDTGAVYQPIIFNATNTRFNSSVQIVDGTQANGYVLTSDAAGNATWQAGGGGSQWINSGANIYFDTGRVNIGGTDFSGNARLTVQAASANANSSVSSINDFGDAYMSLFNAFDGSTSGTKQALFFTSASTNGIASGIAGIRTNNADWRTELAFYVNNITAGPDSIQAIQEAMRIDPNGRVGIGFTAPSYKLDVNGTIRGFGITDASDESIKKDIEPLTGSLAKLIQAQGVTYKLIDETISTRTQIGFIAQQLELVYPELVETDKQGIKSVNYSRLVVPIIEALKVLNDKITSIEQQISDLQG